MKAILMSCNNCNQDYAFETVKNYIKPHMKIACIPFASDLNWQLQEDFTEYKNRHFKIFSDFGIPEENISIIKISNGRSKIMDTIIKSDIVFFSGGFMENIMFLTSVYNLKGFFQSIKEHKLFIGESAGTLVLQDSYMEVPYIEEGYKRYRYMVGLGLIEGYNLMVHYDKYNIYHQKNKDVLEKMEVGKVIGLTDSSLIIIDDDKVELIGDYEL